MTILEGIFEQVTAIKPISTDQFSTDFLGMNPSYYRSMKSRKLEPSTAVLITLMERLGEQAAVMRGGEHALLQRVAAKYQTLGEAVAREIATRSINQTQHSAWVRETIVRIMEEISAARSQNHTWSVPPIIIC
ncbi:hypothetical protein OAI26_09700 [Sulfitobacter sp.]|nr:hypothetical protein [bacterium]MDC0136891.1 hypothetical protein [Sulfitobacter sp.]